ncbi:hypothetical protein A2763_00360 [Candidatus Kaiserbacteria bacterium RIFCSPHIGHO2_01_FULL_54_36]|uniref:HTH arsR-type domain-containing protein n=1 Tax=Candidatus Kaiserbacteria bacterium RIFCSPHIGHO2_01_FULL_54_36 TaxID=1798482 RepID=A0A1F6CLL1_9BACT|nr:MAG: hypothetical protein A2763_00360 [Candidatus Kaiserbacteria bacterium RIFCSPHIGHO2_01_FULL_54_36]OGG75689.1 MAG: hypothetical protein A3A41_04775 [Candidatus Kaiserbacteria bacterium RIFCSPLOWO2_01_FULL_54_22]
MADDFLAEFLGNTARARVTRALAFSAGQSFTLPQIAKRSGIPAKAAAREIKALEALRLIKRGKFSITLQGGRQVSGRQKEKAWTYNIDHKNAPALSKFIHEVSPVQYKHVLVTLKRAGRLAAIILSGSFMGDSTRPADLIVAGDNVSESRLEHAVRSLEPHFGREIRYAAFSTPEFRYRLTIQDRLMRDTLDYPHLVLLDRTRLL